MTMAADAYYYFFMDQTAAATRIRELERLIKKHQDLYYNAEPEISDEEFDALWADLEALDPANPMLRRIGEDKTDGWPKTRHIIPMGSQSKATDPESFIAWARKTKLGQYIVQYKLDGASIELQYEKGLLVRAVTRGDGSIGDDITPNAIRMHGVVSKLPVAFSGGVRGEVLMSHAVHESKYKDKANCRNAANGLMKRKDGLGSEDLDVICYDAVGTVPFETEIEKIEWLAKMGFTTVPTEIFATVDEVIGHRGKIMALRASLEHDIDGLVVKDLAIDPEDLAKARPEKQIAFKFSPEEAVTSLLAVEWSESGALYTPIGIVEPVRLAGTTVRRANLNNPDMIRTLRLKIGSKVVITKRGEIIPKIETLVENPLDAREIEQPTVCGTCSTALVDEGTRLYCPNEACPKKSLHRLEKWLSVLDIKDFGSVILRRLHDAGRVRSIADLYSLSVEELETFERMGHTLAQKILKNLRSVNEISLAEFLAGFDIEGVGLLVAEKLVAAGFDTLDSLVEAEASDLVRIDGIAETMARIIVDGLAAVKPEMMELLSTGAIRIRAAVSAAGGAGQSRNEIVGKSFCFTGELDTMKRQDAEKKIRTLGGSAKSAVTKELDYLVTNDPASGSEKNRKAREYGIPIIDEKEFLAMLDRAVQDRPAQ